MSPKERCAGPYTIMRELAYGWAVVLACPGHGLERARHFLVSQIHVRYGDADIAISREAGEALLALDAARAEEAIRPFELWHVPRDDAATRAEIERRVLDAALDSRASVPFEPQPTLVGSLLTLRPLRAEDFGELYAAASDPWIWEQHPSRDRWQRSVFERFFEDGMRSGGALLATDNADGRVIGSSRFNGFDAGLREVEIGWTFLVRSHWGGSYNGEMKRLMLDHAFRYVDRVTFRIGAANRRSRRAVEKLAAVLLQDRASADGATVVYGISREAWRERTTSRPR